MNDLEWSTCLEKSAYKSRRAIMDTGKAPHAYLCPFCRNWHGTFNIPKTRFEKLLEKLRLRNPKIVYVSKGYEFAKKHYLKWHNAGALVQLHETTVTLQDDEFDMVNMPIFEVRMK